MWQRRLQRRRLWQPQHGCVWFAWSPPKLAWQPLLLNQQQQYPQLRTAAVADDAIAADAGDGARSVLRAHMQG